MPCDLRDGRIELTSASKVAPETAARLARHELKEGDIVFSRRGDVGRTALVTSKSAGTICGTGCLRARPTADVDPRFLALKVQSGPSKRWLEKNAVGQTMPNLNATIVGSLPVSYPNLQVQQNIFEVINVWRASIETCADLIASTCKQRNALAQQLLTGKRRLPGFSGEWTPYRLGQLFKERLEPGRNDLQLLSITTERGVIPQSEVGRKDSSTEDKSKYKRIAPGDIGYNTMRMWQGVSALSSLEGIVSPAYTIVTPGQMIDGDFARHLFKLPRTVHDFRRYSQGLTSDTWNLKFKHFREVTVRVPSVDEQQAIARTLTLAESVIDGYEQLKAKLELEKRALMQQLLTGKVRVPVATESESEA